MEIHDIWYLIINPSSGGGKARKEWPVVQKFMHEAKISFEAGHTLYPGHATELIEIAVMAGYRKFVAVGGDGTINEVVNGIFKQTIISPNEIEFSVIPLGTGSDWIKTYGISRNYKKVIPLLANARVEKQDVGIVSYQTEKGEESHYFVNVAGMAFDAFAVLQSINMNKAGLLGQLSYLGLILGLIPTYKSKLMIVEGDNFRYEGNVFCLNIGICKYNGGGMQTVPDSIPDDGLFDITIIEKMPKWRIFWELRRLYLASIYGAKDVVKFYRTSKLTVSTTESFSRVETDGELLGECPVTFTILPQALNLRLPK